MGEALSGRAWWYLVALSVLIALFGIGDVIGGISVDPGITLGLTGLTLAELQAESAIAYDAYDFATRTQGAALAVVGVLATAILLIPYREGQRWAWWAIWSLPAWTLTVLGLYAWVGLAPGTPPPPPMLSGPVLGTIAVVVLLLDRRRFFGQPVKAVSAVAEAK
jgi:hypothetical protein